MNNAAKEGNFTEMFRLKREHTLEYAWSLVYAASEGNIHIVKLCYEWIRQAESNIYPLFGMSEQFNSALRLAAQNGHIDVVKLMKTYGATDFKGAMIGSIRNGHIDITEYLKSLCLEDIEYTTHFDNNGREIIKVVYLLKG